MKINYLHIIIIILLFFLFGFNSDFNKYRKEITQTNIILNDTIQYLKTNQGKIIASKLAIQGEKESLQMLLESSRDSTKQLKKLVDKYKNVSVAVRTETITEIKKIRVPYKLDIAKFIQPINVIDENYYIQGYSSNKGLFIDVLRIPNTQSIVIGNKKDGFFSYEYRIDVINSNPYITTTSIDGYTNKTQKKRFGIGFQVGYGITGTSLSPYIGFGATYSIIRF